VRRTRVNFGLVAAAAFLAALAGLVPARAAEIATLRNGFELRCDHHSLDDGRIRLYFTAGEDNYIDLPRAEIQRFEPTSEPPPAKTPTPRPDLVEPAAGARLTRDDLVEMLAAAGRAHNLDVDLLASLVDAESSGNPHAVSRAGARGLMQLMPATAAELGVTDSFQASQNVRGGSAYLDTLLTRYNNNLALALAAYNAGPQAVDRYHGIPPYKETRAYVARVIHEFNRRVLAREAGAHPILPSAAVSATAPAAHRASSWLASP